jgi:hypothetical protein
VQVSGVSTIDAGVAPSQGMTGPDLDLFGKRHSEASKRAHPAAGRCSHRAACTPHVLSSTARSLLGLGEAGPQRHGGKKEEKTR